MRQHGSARFEPYFKAQWWDARSYAWRDIQQACASPEEARALFRAGKRWRVMRIAEEGRAPVGEAEQR